MNAYSLPPYATASERRQFVIKVARRCEHFLRRADQAKAQGRSEQAADFRRLAEFQSADAFEAMRA
jgi:hypothetical protein